MKEENLVSKIKKGLKERPYIIIVSIATLINLYLFSIIQVESVQGVKRSYLKLLIATILVIEIGKRGHVSKVFGTIFLTMLIIFSIVFLYIFYDYVVTIYL